MCSVVFCALMLVSGGGYRVRAFVFNVRLTRTVRIVCRHCTRVKQKKNKTLLPRQLDQGFSPAVSGRRVRRVFGCTAAACSSLLLTFGGLLSSTACCQRCDTRCRLRNIVNVNNRRFITRTALTPKRVRRHPLVTPLTVGILRRENTTTQTYNRMAQNKTIRMGTVNKLRRQHRTMIKSIAILFEVEISMTICTINKLKRHIELFYTL